MVLGEKISHVLLLNMKRSSVTPLLFFLSGVFSRKEVLHLGRKVAVL